MKVLGLGNWIDGGVIYFLKNIRGGIGLDREGKNEFSMGNGEFEMFIYIGRWIYRVWGLGKRIGLEIYLCEVSV